MSELKHVEIYVADRYDYKLKLGSYGAILCYNRHKKEVCEAVLDVNSSSISLVSTIRTLKLLKEPCRVTFYSSNKYVVESMTKGWIQRWKDNDWKNAKNKPIKHVELWKEILALSNIHKIEFTWIPSDSNNPYRTRSIGLAMYALYDRMDI